MHSIRTKKRRKMKIKLSGEEFDQRSKEISYNNFLSGFSVTEEREYRTH